MAAVGHVAGRLVGRGPGLHRHAGSRPDRPGTGVLLTLARGGLPKAAAVVGTRLTTSLVVSAVLVSALGLSEVDRALLFLLAVAPVACMTVTFAVLKRLDAGLASATLSLCLLASLVLSPVVAFLLR